MLLKTADIGCRGPLFSANIIFFFYISGSVRVRIFFGPDDAIGLRKHCGNYVPQLYVKFDFFEKSFFKI